MSERFFDSRANRDKLDAWLTTPPEERFDYGPQFDEGDEPDEPDCVGCGGNVEPLAVIVTFDRNGAIVNTYTDSLSEWPALHNVAVETVEFKMTDGSVMHVSRQASHFG